MNNYQQENVISTQGQSRHNIKRYEFKVLDSLAKEESQESFEPLSSLPLDSHVPQENPPPSPSTPPTPSIPASLIENELIERLLQKSDELAGSLAKMQMQLDKQQKEMDSLIKEAREEARTLGIKEGQEQARAAMQEEVEEQKRALIASIELLEGTSKEMEKQIGSLERELSAIAVDIAKEVIVKEVSEKSAEVAHALAKNLLDSLKEATKVLLKLNPQDYALLVKHFEGEERIKIQPDKAIAKGGVVIISDNGN
ncbi:MAG: flagellar assembly protein FliH, partial [Wolinella sp.]